MGQVGNLTEADQEIIRSQARKSLTWCLVPWLMGPETLGAALCATAAQEYGGPGVMGAVGEWGYYQFNAGNRDKYVPGWDSASPPDLAAQTDGAIRYVRDQGVGFVLAAANPMWTNALFRGAWHVSLWDAGTAVSAAEPGVWGALARGVEYLKVEDLAVRMWDEFVAWVWGCILGAAAAGIAMVVALLAYFGKLKWASYVGVVGLAGVAVMAIGGPFGFAGLLVGAVVLGYLKMRGRGMKSGLKW